MKLSKLWKTLTRDQRRAWSAWAKGNRVLLDNGVVRRVSGHKAMTMVLRNRAVAGEAAEPSVLPAATTWRDGALSLRDAGPWTTNAGYIGFRAEAAIPAGTKWFVWATPVLDGEDPSPQARLRFVKVLAPAAMAFDDVTANSGTDYAAVNGDWHGPGQDGAWPTEQCVWFRLHHYAYGQLSPGVMMKGRILTEL